MIIPALTCSSGLLIKQFLHESIGAIIGTLALMNDLALSEIDKYCTAWLPYCFLFRPLTEHILIYSRKMIQLIHVLLRFNFTKNLISSPQT